MCIVKNCLRKSSEKLRISMEAQASSLFYEKKYETLAENLQKSPGTSISKTHNLIIANFLNKSTDPLSELEAMENKIRNESTIEDSWPLHPSYPLIQYHKALYFFNTGNEPKCFKLLQDIWKHSKFINFYLLLFISILTEEFSIRYSKFELSDKATSFISKNCPNEQSITHLLNPRIPNPAVVNSLLERVRFLSLRLKIAKAHINNNDESRRLVLESLQKIENNLDPKKKKNIPMNCILGFCGASLYHKPETPDKNDKSEKHEKPDKTEKINAFEKLEKLLSQVQNQQDCHLLNNKGVLEFAQQRYSSALLFFSKALAASNSLSNNQIQYTYQRIIYNIGLSLLFKHKPKKSFRYLFSIAPSLSHFPYLWLRLAECCVLFFKQRVAKLRRRTQYSNVIARKLSTATKTFTILPSSDAKLFSRYANQAKGIESHLTLEFAEKCAENAISLIPDSEVSLKAASYLLGEYICLELGDWQGTTEMSKHPISANNIEPLTKFLSRIYAAQALYMLHDSNQAGSLLKLNLIEAKFIGNNESALALYQTSWRVIQDKAITYLNRTQENDNGSREVLLCKVADELKSKRIKSALAALESYKPKTE